MIRVGLTGSIAMGKTTAARFFAEAGAGVYDADAAVHALYAAGGGAGERLRRIFPQAVTPDGAVRRDELRRLLEGDPGKLAELEAEVFPLLQMSRDRFVATAKAEGRTLAVLDIPLLFETDAQDTVDAVVVVTASPDVQAARALARPGMTRDTFDLLLARQLPDLEKRRRADFVISTDDGLDHTRGQVLQIVDVLTSPGWLTSRTRDPTAWSHHRDTASSGLGGSK